MRREVCLYNPRLNRLEAICAQKDRAFGMYCCGPTVYGPAHIGNFRTYVLQDILRRVLEFSGVNVFHMRNVTDVDDKTITQSQKEGKSLEEFTEHWKQQFAEDCKKLNLLVPTLEPSAVKHIPQQIELIKILLEKELAYVAEDGSVYFRISTFKDYGKLSGIQQEHLSSQQENSAGNPNLVDEYERESCADFALWKAHKPLDGENAWNSPWGRGRPGWHIECSAMAMYYLGPTIDLHAGGIDLLFPHHENEIAQSEAAMGVPFVRYWFHSNHLVVEGQKMSKRLGNLYTLNDLISKYSLSAIRYLLLSGHYRQILNFTFQALEAAEKALRRLWDFIAGFEPLPSDLEISSAIELGFGPWEKALKALLEDLHTPQCLGEIFKVIKQQPVLTREEILPLFKLLKLLGLPWTSPTSDFFIPQEVKILAEQRWKHKQKREFAEADRCRLLLESMGWKIQDMATGYQALPRSK